MGWFFKTFDRLMGEKRNTAAKGDTTESKRSSSKEIRELGERLLAVEYSLAKAATAFSFQDATLRALAKQLGCQLGRQTPPGQSKMGENESSAAILSFPTDESGRNPTET
jgi:hypothetical protein